MVAVLELRLPTYCDQVLINLRGNVVVRNGGTEVTFFAETFQLEHLTVVFATFQLD